MFLIYYKYGLRRLSNEKSFCGTRGDGIWAGREGKFAIGTEMKRNLRRFAIGARGEISRAGFAIFFGGGIICATKKIGSGKRKRGETSFSVA